MVQKSEQTLLSEEFTSLNAHAEAFYLMSDLPIAAWWPSGIKILSFGTKDYESLIYKNDRFVRDEHTFAGKMSYELKSPYIYETDNDFIFIACTNASPDRYNYFVTVGPVILEEISESTLKYFLSQQGNYVQGYNTLQKTKILRTKQVSALAKICGRIFATYVDKATSGQSIQKKTIAEQAILSDLELLKNLESLDDDDMNFVIDENRIKQLIKHCLEEADFDKALHVVRKNLRDMLLIYGYTLDTITVKYMDIMIFCIKQYIQDDVLKQNEYHDILDFITRLTTVESTVEISNIFEALFHYLSNMTTLDKTKKYSPNIERCLKIIRQHSHENINLSTVADMLYVNKSHLSKQFKEEVNVNFTSYLNQIRIDNAKDMLIRTDEPVAEILQKCGFSNHSYFSKTFAKYTGYTPTQYRNKFKKA